jgi:hypothetical protein
MIYEVVEPWVVLDVYLWIHHNHQVDLMMFQDSMKYQLMKMVERNVELRVLL